MKKPILILLLVTCIASSVRSQDSLDSLLNSLYNRDLFVLPIMPRVLILKETIVKKDTTTIRRGFLVSSLDEDVYELAKKYSKNILVTKLYVLLKDPERDLYANALLYDLLENKKLGKFMFMKREEWVNNERWISDINHWKAYMEKEVYIY